jgi:hypothetical protein
MLYAPAPATESTKKPPPIATFFEHGELDLIGPVGVEQRCARETEQHERERHPTRQESCGNSMYCCVPA